jgi:hypothetical protein
MVRFGAGDLHYRTEHRLFQPARTIFGAECAYIQRCPGEKLQATTTPHCRDAGGAGRMVQAAMTMLLLIASVHGLCHTMNHPPT